MVTKKTKKNLKSDVSEKIVAKKTVAAKSSKPKTIPVSAPVAKKPVVKNESGKDGNTAYVIIDHPCENETIGSDNYVIRIGASFDGYVEISFNGGEWQPCRFASGYWWFDWMYYKPGIVKISARIVSNDGKIIKISDIRKCKVS